MIKLNFRCKYTSKHQLPPTTKNPKQKAIKHNTQIQKISINIKVAMTHIGRGMR